MLESAYEHVGGWLGSKHRELNYKICAAIDPIKMSIVLDELVKEGMEPAMAKIFKAQADGLLAAIRSENNRLKLAREPTNEH